MTASPGLHHITAICSDPERTLAFYEDLLGLRLVKRTVNFDDPSAWHLYFGDENGSPGSLLTFFCWPDAVPGTPGLGEVVSVSLAIPRGASAFWADRLVDFGLPFAVGADDTLVFHDPDGLALELVERDYAADLPGFDSAEVPGDRAPRGLATATLLVDRSETTGKVLTECFGWREEGRATIGDFTRIRYVAPGAPGPGSAIELLSGINLTQGEQGAGSVHHIAFRAVDGAAQAAMADAWRAQGLTVTSIRDRSYFQSVYAREPSGVLLEIATDGPGFLIDETLSTLGSRLQLPEALEPMRADIERLLPPID